MIEVSQNIIEVTIVAEQGGISVELQPVLVINGGGGFDGIVNGGTP